MNNPAWILAQLAPVVVAYAETLTSMQLFGQEEFRGLSWLLDDIMECGEDCNHPEVCALGHLENLGELKCMKALTRYALDTIPHNTPTWHAFLLFLRYYG